MSEVATLEPVSLDSFESYNAVGSFKVATLLNDEWIYSSQQTVEQFGNDLTHSCGGTEGSCIIRGFIGKVQFFETTARQNFINQNNTLGWLKFKKPGTLNGGI